MHWALITITHYKPKLLVSNYLISTNASPSLLSTDKSSFLEFETNTFHNRNILVVILFHVPSNVNTMSYKFPPFCINNCFNSKQRQMTKRRRKNFLCLCLPKPSTCPGSHLSFLSVSFRKHFFEFLFKKIIICLDAPINGGLSKTRWIALTF